MSIENQSTVPNSPNGTGLLIFGLLSVILGPITVLPGLLFSKRFRPFSTTAVAGYVLCWLSLTFYAAVFLLLISYSQIR